MKYIFISLLFLGNSVFSQSNLTPQVISDKALLSMIKSQQAVNGLAIVMDNNTGKVVSTSGYSKKGSSYVIDTSLLTTAIEPGGLMIPISAAVLMDNFGVTLNDTVDLEGGVTNINNLKVYDSEMHGIRSANLLRVISESSNVGIAKLTNTSFSGKQLNSFFVNKAEAYLGGNEKIFTGAESKTSLPFWAFGYGVMLTPNQILSFYKRLAMNDATLFSNPNTLQQVRLSLKGVVKNGTAKVLFKNSALDVAGKTATILALSKNGYSNGQYISAMVGYTSQFTCLVIIKCKPHAAQHYGAVVAGPVVKQILERVSTN